MITALDEKSTSHHMLTSAASAGSLLIVAAFGICCIYRKHRKTEGKCIGKQYWVSQFH